MALKLEKARRKSLVDVAYEVIKKAIIEGDVLPGQYLRETEIAAQMGTSRGPVREALTRLAQEGLTFSHPFRGTVVLETSNEEMESVFVPTRRTIELFAALSAHNSFSEVEFAALQSIINRMGESCLSDNVNELTNLDIAFHNYLVVHATSPSVRALWNNIVSRIHARMIYQGIHHKYLSTVVAEHTQYLNLVIEGSSIKIEDHLSTHIY